MTPARTQEIQEAFHGTLYSLEQMLDVQESSLYHVETFPAGTTEITFFDVSMHDQNGRKVTTNLSMPMQLPAPSRFAVQNIKGFSSSPLTGWQYATYLGDYGRVYSKCLADEFIDYGERMNLIWVCSYCNHCSSGLTCIGCGARPTRWDLEDVYAPKSGYKVSIVIDTLMMFYAKMTGPPLLRPTTIGLIWQGLHARGIM